MCQSCIDQVRLGVHWGHLVQFLALSMAKYWARLNWSGFEGEEEREENLIRSVFILCCNHKITKWKMNALLFPIWNWWGFYDLCWLTCMKGTPGAIPLKPVCPVTGLPRLLIHNWIKSERGVERFRVANKKVILALHWSRNLKASRTSPSKR